MISYTPNIPDNSQTRQSFSSAEAALSAWPTYSFLKDALKARARNEQLFINGLSESILIATKKRSAVM